MQAFLFQALLSQALLSQALLSQALFVSGPFCLRHCFDYFRFQANRSFKLLNVDSPFS